MSEPTSQQPGANYFPDTSTPWFDAIGNVVTPLLAGFSVSAVIVVSDDASNFRWPGPAILALTIAGTVLIAAIQCAYHGRIWTTRSSGPPAPLHLILWKNRDASEMGLFFTQWTRRAYNGGVVALLAGLALAIPPPHGSGIQANFRWFASGIAFAACATEMAWILNKPILLKKRARTVPGYQTHWLLPQVHEWPSHIDL
jgi:hypothetical protein